MCVLRGGCELPPTQPMRDGGCVAIGCACVPGGGGQCSRSPAVRMEVCVGRGEQETPDFCCLRGGAVSPSSPIRNDRPRGQPCTGGGMGSPPPIWRHPLPLAAPAVLNPPLPNSRAGSRGCTQPSHVGCPPPPLRPPSRGVSRAGTGRFLPAQFPPRPAPPGTLYSQPWQGLPPSSAAPSDPGIALLPAEILPSLPAVGLGGGGTAVRRASPLGRGARGTPSYGAGQVGLLRAKGFG